MKRNYEFYRTLPGGEFLSRDDIRFVHYLYKIWEHFYSRSLHVKIYHFRKYVQKTVILKSKLTYARMTAFNFKARNPFFPIVNFYIKIIDYLLALIKIGEEYRNPEVLGLRILHKESIGFARVGSYTTKDGEVKVWSRFDWSKSLY